MERKGAHYSNGKVNFTHPFMVPYEEQSRIRQSRRNERKLKPTNPSTPKPPSPRSR